jgi:hypothetical protein
VQIIPSINISTALASWKFHLVPPKAGNIRTLEIRRRMIYFFSMAMGFAIPD